MTAETDNFVKQKVSRDAIRRWHLYSLKSPINGARIYVGVTSEDEKRYLRRITYAAKRLKRSGRDEAVAQLLSIGEKPIIETIATSSQKEEILALKWVLARSLRYSRSAPPRQLP